MGAAKGNTPASTQHAARLVQRYSTELTLITCTVHCVPSWKFYRAGHLIATVDGDWTKSAPPPRPLHPSKAAADPCPTHEFRFEPLLAALAGPPRKTVPLTPADAATLAAARRTFQKLAVKLARREARRNDTRGARETDTDSESDWESGTDSEVEEGAAVSNHL